MSMSLTATALEIPFSNAPVARAIAPDASLQFPAAMHARSDAFPGGNVAQIGHAFLLPNANRNHAKPRPLRLLPDRGILFPVRAKLSALPGPFVSSARRSFEIFVDLPEASQSIDRADCSDSERAVSAEASCDHASLGLLAAVLGPIQSR